MAIRIVNRSLDIPISERTVGYAGDNLVEVRSFELSRYYRDIDLADFSFKLDTEIGGVKNIIDLEKSVTDDTITLRWTIAKSHVLYPGHMTIQIRAFSGNEEIWHSDLNYVQVQPSINASAAIPDPLPSEFVQMEQRVTVAKNAAEEAAQMATEQANIATQKAEEVENIRDSIVTEEEARQIAEADRVSNEQNRIEAENERIIEENIRKSNEVLRQTNENTRNNNENERVLAENERIANEEARQTNEQNRETAETARDTAEAIRANNEAARIAAENNRNTAEQARIEAENTREANEATRQSNEAARQAAIADIEYRFTQLEIGQQQDAEVILARKGYDSLGKRLDDIDSNLAEIPQRGMLKFLSMLQAGLISKIKLIGDSITAGEGATGHTVPVDNPIIFDDGAGNVFREGCYDCRCWANYFREYIKANYPTVQFINAGIGGASAKWADENKQYWVDDDEDVVFVQLGTNDRSQSASIPAFKASLKSFLSYIRARSNLVIVMTANPALTDGSFPFGMDKIDAAISELCIEENYPHISNFRDMLDYSINSKTRLVELVQGAAYGSHPVDAGHLFMWQNIQQKLGIIDGYTNWDNFLKRVPVYNLPADSVTATTPITDFQLGITICNITPTGATGFPGNASGVYIVYRSDVNDLYSYAEYRLRSNGFTYRRIHGASGWGSFVFYIPVINKSDDSVSGSSPLSYFQSNAITRIEIGGSHPNIATFPEGAAGTLITHREGADLTAYQEYFIRGTNRVYKRYWKTSAWAQWAAIEGARYATADRPTADLPVGYSYFDTTLGKPLWLKATSPRYIWVDSTGAEV